VKLGETTLNVDFKRGVQQEIRQTKASLAKMEHNRQYLAEQRRREVDQWSRQVQNRLTHPPAMSTPMSAFSMPSLYWSPQQLGLYLVPVLPILMLIYFIVH